MFKWQQNAGVSWWPPETVEEEEDRTVLSWKERTNERHACLRPKSTASTLP